jgi:hypothetical protein
VNTVQARLDPADRNDVAARLWPRAKAEVDDEVAANTVEMLVTNLAPRRETPSISGPHFVSMFEAAGFPDMPSYKRTKQFQDCKNVAQNYYPDQWSDLEVMGLTQPFPFLVDINPAEQTLAKIDNTRGPGALTDHLPPAHDPWNSQICPFGRE